jgi:RimJ/RimL family protein N-acetyltransferase
MIEMSFIELESERLLYRRFYDCDFEAVQDLLGNNDTMRLMRMSPCSEAEGREFLRFSVTLANAADCVSHHFAVVMKNTKCVIGIGFFECADINSEIGWILHRDCWNRGYGTELGRTLLEFGFGRLGLRRIIAHCDAENIGSYRVMEKIGMRREGYAVKGRLGNAVLMS